MLNEGVYGTNGFFDRGSEIGSVEEENVDIVHLETLERSLESFDQVLARVTLLVGIALSSTEEDLGRNDELRAVDVELLESTTHLSLRFSVRVNSE